MRRSAVSPALLLAGLLGPSPIAHAGQALRAADPALNPAAVRQALWTALNQERTRAGSPPFVLQPELERAAQARAEEIGRHGSLSDERGQEERTRRRLEATGYRAQEWVESAVSSTDDIAALVRTWQRQSGGTYGQVMAADYRDLGIGVGRLDGAPLYTMLFAAPEREYFRRRTAALRDLAAVRAAIRARTNAERARAGRAPLAASPDLDRAAQAHAEDMLARGYFEHESPERKTVRERARGQGYDWRAVGENIALGQLTVDEVMDSWMKSPEHRENILDRDYRDLGVGLALGDTRKGFRVLWVQTFGRRLPR
jgi:uncharacterized protein YkwD